MVSAGRGRFLGVIAASTAAVLLGGCSTRSSHGAESVSVVASAAAATEATHTAEIITTSSGAGSPPSTQRMLYDFQRQLGEILPSSDPKDPIPEVIFDHDTVYFDLASMFATGFNLGVNLGGKTWLVETEPTASGSEKALQTLFDPMSPTIDMGTWLNELAPIVNHVQRLGPATIDGSPTTKYNLTISPSHMKDLVGAMPSTDRVSFSPVTIWVDDQGRLRQVSFSFSMPEAGTVMESSTYTDFGIAVNVAVPPANETMTMQQFQTLECAAMKNQANGAVVGQITVFSSGGTSDPCSSSKP